MAIPFNVPSDEYTLDQYRRIHQLLLDLMDMLRGFTGGFGFPDPQPPVARNNNNNNNNSTNNNSGPEIINVSRNVQGISNDNNPAESARDANHRSNLPDLVASTLNEAAVYFRNLEREAVTAAAAGGAGTGTGTTVSSSTIGDAAAARSNGDDRNESNADNEVGRRPNTTGGGNGDGRITAPHMMMMMMMEDDSRLPIQTRRRSVSSRRSGSRVRAKFAKRKKDKPDLTSTMDNYSNNNKEVVLHSIHCGWLQNRRPGGTSACSCMYQFRLQDDHRYDLFSATGAADGGHSDNNILSTTSSSATDITTAAAGGAGDGGTAAYAVEDGGRGINQQSYRCFVSCGRSHYPSATNQYRYDNYYKNQQQQQQQHAQNHHRKLNSAKEPSSSRVPSWLRIGEELRKVAESFKTSHSEAGKDNKETGKDDEVKIRDSLLAVLLPNQLGRTMIATVLIYIGWKLLRSQ